MFLLKQSVKIPPISGPCWLGGWLFSTAVLAVGVSRSGTTKVCSWSSSFIGWCKSWDFETTTLRSGMVDAEEVAICVFHLYTRKMLICFFKCGSWMYDLLTYVCFIWNIYIYIVIYDICIIFIIPSIPSIPISQFATQKGPTKVCFQHSNQPLTGQAH